MKDVKRVNITDPILLRRIEQLRQRIGDKSLTKTTCRFLEENLTRIGIGMDLGATRNQPITDNDARHSGAVTVA